MPYFALLVEILGNESSRGLLLGNDNKSKPYWQLTHCRYYSKGFIYFNSLRAYDNLMRWELFQRESLRNSPKVTKVLK